MPIHSARLPSARSFRAAVIESSIFSTAAVRARDGCNGRLTMKPGVDRLRCARHSVFSGPRLAQGGFDAGEGGAAGAGQRVGEGCFHGARRADERRGTHGASTNAEHCQE